MTIRDERPDCDCLTTEHCVGLSDLTRCRREATILSANQNKSPDKQETSVAEDHDWQPDGNTLKFESHPGGEALHVHTTCTKCGARAWFLEYQWELLSKGCASSQELWPQAGTFHCACIFNRAEDFGVATLVKACAYHARREEALSARGELEEKPVAWLIERPKGTGKQQTIEYELVLSPLTDDTFMDEGDEAWPLYKKKSRYVGEKT